ncbi:PorP/SprF family type IX secretion system membrane protein [Adhaeribacter aquaticus]|uniref:PorP/SprF family type IX secretion system membrane protein n=1 Tax=Adhaeribacter aquaticus TaxID=299567 RepID=UPI0004791481|nr:type IX secretion system membrane protein PorP/SprF [Adhaeribacter aquaticus]
MKHIYLLIAAVFMSVSTMAQQRPHFSQYMLNNYLLNPALSGIEDYTDVKVGFRQQWVGLEGAPSTFYVTAHTPLNKTDIATSTVRNRNIKIKRIGIGQRARPHHGLGVVAQADKTGPLQNTLLNASYAYHLPLNSKTKISAGVSGGLLQYNLNPQMVHLRNQNDPTLYDNNINELKMDLNVGLWLYSKNYFVGVSGSQLLRDTGTRETQVTFNGSGNLQKHFVATAGYRIEVNPEVAVIPSFQVNYATPSPVSVDLNLKATYADRVWVGGSLRKGDAFAGMAGINISSLLSLGYSYDITTSALTYNSAGSHEIVMGLKLQNRGKVICPIWLW